MSRLYPFAVSFFLLFPALLGACSDSSGSGDDPTYCETNADCYDNYVCTHVDSNEDKICVFNTLVDDCTGDNECTDAGDTSDGGIDAGDTGGGGIDASSPGQLDAPDEIEFTRATIGETVSKTIELRNVGQGELTITNLEQKEQASGQYDAQREFFKGAGNWEDLPVTLPAGASHSITVDYRAHNEESDVGSVVVESDDPSRPIHEILLFAPSRP